MAAGRQRLSRRVPIPPETNQPKHERLRHRRDLLPEFTPCSSSPKTSSINCPQLQSITQYLNPSPHSSPLQHIRHTFIVDRNRSNPGGLYLRLTATSTLDLKQKAIAEHAIFVN